MLGFAAVALVAGGAYLSTALEGIALELIEARLATAGQLVHDQARTLLERGAPVADLHAFVTAGSRPTGLRVTLIAPDGRVLADSSVAPADVPALENHGGRPEVREALAGRQGRDVRTSASVHQPFMYVGLPVRDADRIVGVVRLALPRPAVTASLSPLRHVLLLGALVGLAVALGVAIVVSRHITRPVIEMQRVARLMTEGDFTARAPTASMDEIGALGRALNTMSSRFRDKIEDLQDEQRKVATILDAMVEGVIAVDGDDRVMLINEQVRTMFGLPAAPYEGKPLLEVVRHADVHAVVRLTRNAADDSPVRRQIHLASNRVIQVNAMPLRLGPAPGGAAAPPGGVVMVLDDVSDVRRLEQVRTEFVANVSHELRTPLTAIQGYVETLLAGAINDPENGRPFLEVVHRHTERLGRLLGDLTDLSNIELGRVALRLQAVELTDVVDSVLAVMNPRADVRSVALESMLPPQIPLVTADHDRLEQVLINLVDNAVKYTPEGGRVTVTAALVDPATAQVSVVDTGMGIPPTDLPRVTERFYRVDKARSRELGGTGLGLAIVKHLVHAHGGELTIESEPGRGTTVRFTLPVAGAAPSGQR